MRRAAMVAGLVGWVGLLFLLERSFPLRRRRRPQLPRLVVNGVFGAIALATVALAVRPAAEAALARGRTGIIPSLLLPAPLKGLLSFLLMDLTFYWWHRANHRIGFLWRFHNVHHLDPDLDVSTALRFHGGELLFSSGFRVLQIALAAPTPALYLLYEACFQMGTMFHHSNLRLPERLERIVNLAVVTPRMHGIHHSFVREETNSDYGTIFTFWDRLHGTLRLSIPQDRIVIGVPGYDNPHDNRLAEALLHPFRQQRQYWP